MKISPCLLSFVLIGMAASVAHAQFQGDYALTPPPADIFSGNTTVGNWNFTAQNSGAAAQLTTVFAPANLTLGANGNGLSISSTAILAYTGIPAAGTISFDYLLNASAGAGGGIASFTYGHSDDKSVTLVTSGTGSVSWDVVAGENLIFSVSAMGGMEIGAGGVGGDGGIGGIGGIGGNGGTGGTGSIPTPTASFVSATVSNFSFTPSTPIPEPSAFALGGGLMALAAACWRRRNRAV